MARSVKAYTATGFGVHKATSTAAKHTLCGRAAVPIADRTKEHAARLRASDALQCALCDKVEANAKVAA